MAELAEAFETHLRSLSDAEWDALVSRVRPSKAPPPQPPLPGERRDEPAGKQPKFANAGLEEAYRRGFIDERGKQVQPPPGSDQR